MAEWPVVFVSQSVLPIPVGPPVEKYGKTCVRICATCPWLQKIAFGHGSYQKNEAEYTRAVIVQLRAAAHAIRQQTGTPVEATSAPALQDDDLLGLGSESEAEEQPPPHGSRKSIARNSLSSWQTVELHDVPINVLVGMGVSLFVELDLASIQAVVSALRAERRKQGDAAPVAKLAEREDEGKSCLLPTDEGRVSWSATRHSFVITYESAKAKRMLTHSRPDLMVPRNSSDGSPLSSDMLKKDCEKKVRKAREIWNALDRSETPRYTELGAE